MSNVLTLRRLEPEVRPKQGDYALTKVYYPSAFDTAEGPFYREVSPIPEDIAYAYSNPDEKSGHLTLEQAKIAAINLHEYPVKKEVEVPDTPLIINRSDPAWAMFAAAALAGNCYDHIGACNFADAMIRERDRRDREERP